MEYHKYTHTNVASCSLGLLPRLATSEQGELPNGRSLIRMPRELCGSILQFEHRHSIYTLRAFEMGVGGMSSGRLHALKPRGAGYLLSSQTFHSMTEAVLDDQYSIRAAGRFWQSGPMSSETQSKVRRSRLGQLAPFSTVFFEV